MLAANPQSGRATRDVSQALVSLADHLSTYGGIGVEQAISYYERGLNLGQELLAANPQSAQAARDVSIAMERLAECLESRRNASDAERALGYREDNLKLREALLKDSPQSALLVRDLALALDGLAGNLAQQKSAGSAERALACYQRSLEIKEKLLAANPQSASAVRDVVVSHHNIAQFQLRASQLQLAQRHFIECHSILHKAVSTGMTFDPSIMTLYQKLHGVYASQIIRPPETKEFTG